MECTVREPSSKEVVAGMENLARSLVSYGIGSECEPMHLNRVMHDQSNVSSWVLLKDKEIQQFVGMGCERFEDQFLALLTAIESSHANHRKFAIRKQRELKRLTCSLNYEGRPL